MSALERIQAAADRISARLDEKALKRVERFLGVWGDVPRDVSGTHHEVTGRWTSLRVADVRAVLALAKRAEAHQHVAKQYGRALTHFVAIAASAHAESLLDGDPDAFVARLRAACNASVAKSLHRPLPKRGRR